MNIKLTTALDVRDGYGYIGQNLALALDKLGQVVWVNPIKAWYSEEQLNPRIKELMIPNKPDFELLIMYPVHKFEDVHSNAAIMTMYEAHRCPTEWTRAINRLNIPLIAPSKFVENMFRESGVKVPLQTLTLGVDSDTYRKRLRTYPEGRPFRFFTMGKMEPRKNVEVTVRCFQEAFPNNENVELIIKTRERFLPSAVRSSSDKRIRIIEKTLTEPELATLYHYCDCFVYPSRGEGFSFPPRNAIATGMPTLVTNWSALNEIPGAERIAITGISSMYPCGFSYGEHDKMFMADIDEEDLYVSMQVMYGFHRDYNIKAKKVYEVKQDTWEDCAKNLIRMINELA